MPLFASVTIDELFRMAGAGRQTRHQPGRAIHQEGSPAEGVQLLLDGRLALTDRAGMSQEIRAPAVLGFEEVLAGSALRQTAQALDSSALLTITTEEFLTLLSDNTELVEGLFRTLLSDPHFRTNLVITGGAAADAFAPEAAGGLTGIEKALVLSRIPLFATAAADDLLAIAAIARETALVDGAVLFKENEPPALYALVQGRLSLESEEHGSVEAEASDAVAVYETLAGTPTGRRAQVRQPGTALRIDRDELFDLLGHSPTLLQDLFRALFRSKVAGPML
jgi:CRP-like cAMP-binding protein